MNKLLKKIKLYFSPIIKLLNRKAIKKNRLFEELFENVKGGKIRVTISNIPGEYFLDARSHILKRILLAKVYEPEISDLILRYLDKEKDAINVGANVGLFTSFLAKNINVDRKVLAIEPTLNAIQTLKQNISINNVEEKVILFEGIASDKANNYILNVIPGKEEYSSLGEITYSFKNSETPIPIEVSGQTLDSLVNKYNINPGIIVMDVEGAEYLVLKGAMKVLQEFKPIIISELNDRFLGNQNITSKNVVDYLSNLGYSVINEDGEKIKFPFVGSIICIPY